MIRIGRYTKALVSYGVTSEGSLNSRSDRLTPAARDYELTWANKERLLDGADGGGYRWIDRDDPRALEVRAFLPRALVGDVSPKPSDRNLLIRGDALHAARGLAFLPGYGDAMTGSVRLVYIDPPFNKGQGFGQYPDALRHSVWLSMLQDRLVAIKPLLGPLASVWVHLDDAEQHRARSVLDEVFGPDAFVSTIVWQKRTTRESRAAFSNNHDYIHVYAPAGPRRWKTARNPLVDANPRSENRDNDPRGPWVDAPFTAPGYRANQQYEIVNPAGVPLRPPKGRSWYATRDVFDSLMEENRIWFPRDGAGTPRLKRFPGQLTGLVPFSIWGPAETGTNDDATKHLLALFPDREAFATPKPETLMERVIHVASDPGDVVLDFFAGSGTTVTAAHKMRRRWIAVEASDDTVETYTLPRLTRVVAGDDPGGITAKVGWLGGGGFEVIEVAASSVKPQANAHSGSSIPVGAFTTASRP
jgi:adenine-specific DNA-methyltransferase